MQISAIVRRINELLAGEMLSFDEMKPYLDHVIDDINQQLNTIYPVFSELPSGTAVYDCFPDRYIRNVVCMGAALYFYMTDEEGSQAPMGYTASYQNALFLMLRDYVHMIPLKWQATTEAGTVSLDLKGADLAEYGVSQSDFLI